MSERTIQVRIPVALNHRGEWNAAAWAHGGKPQDDDECRSLAIDGLDSLLTPETIVWITAEIPVPQEVHVNGAVESIERIEVEG